MERGNLRETSNFTVEGQSVFFGHPRLDSGDAGYIFSKMQAFMKVTIFA